jgi:hypothetical protein
MRRLLIVIVPYRNRPAHLATFMQRVWSPLHREHPRSELIVADQGNDDRLFNRGGLLNCAYAHARARRAWRVLFHDVDLVPCASVRRAYYECSGEVVHFAHCWRDRYVGPHYFGGVVGFSPRAFERVDGFPGTFWGWGGEDDALLRRVRAARLRVHRPCHDGTYEDLERLTLRQKLCALRDAGAKCVRKRELLARQRYEPGLRAARYRARRVDATRVVFSIAGCRAARRSATRATRPCRS